MEVHDSKTIRFDLNFFILVKMVWGVCALFCLFVFRFCLFFVVVVLCVCVCVFFFFFILVPVYLGAL